VAETEEPEAPIPRGWSDRIVVVLVQPLQPGNVGAAARAMKNFGLSRLVLVDPPSFDPERARWMAPGCDDVIDAMWIVGSLDEALEGVHEVVGTTARHRKLGPPVCEPADVGRRIFTDEDPDRVTAILFGREDFGLPNEAVLRCRSLVRIATPEHASLNLGQAVMLVSYELFQEARRHGVTAKGRLLGGSKAARSTSHVAAPDARDNLAPVGVVEPVVTELVEVLDRVGYLRGTPADKVRLTARGALQTARLSVRHVEALRGMLAKLRYALEHPKAP
jgi:tRNA (cytidine32/uridine32-2'-O)-methyltransferase